MPRLRDNGWLKSEVASLKAAGVTDVISMLTISEEVEVGLIFEGEFCEEMGLRFHRYSLPDRSASAWLAGVLLAPEEAVQQKVFLVNSEEAHQGTPAVTGGWRCRTMHIHPSAIKQIAADIKPFGTVRDVVFPSPTIEDIQLTQELLYLHRRSEMANSPLERQSRIVALIGHLCERYAGINQNASEARSREFHLVRRARDYLQENLAFKVTLDELSNVASLPPFRLLRAFQLTFGLTPHAYQTQARVRAAYAMLRLQTNIADIAAQTGFADQAHLTRVFKSLMGATPGQYRTALAAARPNARP